MQKRTLLVSATALLVAIASSCAAPISLSPTWEFSNPEGISTLTNQSAAGFEFTVADIRGTIVPDPDNPGLFLGRDGPTSNAVRPRVYQTFGPLDMTLVGNVVEVSFDLELLDPFIDDNRGDLHISLFDTATNYEMFPLIHLGPNSDRTDFIKFRIDGFLTPGTNVFDPGSVENLAVGGNSRGPQTNHPGVPLADTGFIHTFKLRVERVSSTELSITTTWSYVDSDNPETGPLGTATWAVASYNEATGVIDGSPNPGTSDIWANSKLSQFDGFGFLLHENDPFNADGNQATLDEGTMVVSNFTVDFTTPVHPPFQIIDVSSDGADKVITWEAQPGSTYSVFTTTTLTPQGTPGGWDELSDNEMPATTVGSYTHQNPEAAQQRFYRVIWNGPES